MAERRAYLKEMTARAKAILPELSRGTVTGEPPYIKFDADKFWPALEQHVAHERSLVMQHPSQDVTKLLARAVALLDGAVILKPPVVGDRLELDGVELQKAWDAERDEVVKDAKAVLP